jgi:hypothetical protein
MKPHEEMLHSRANRGISVLLNDDHDFQKANYAD